MLLYVLTAISMAGMAHIETFTPETAMAEAFSLVNLNWASYIIYFCGVFGIAAACFANLMVSLFKFLTNLF